MADLTYNRARTDILDGDIDLLTGTIKAMLVGSGYTANKDDVFVDDGGANDPIDEELSGTGYAAGFAGAGRKTLGSKTVTQDDANDRAEFDFADLSWTGIDAGTADAMIVYHHITSDAASQLIAYNDSGGWPKTTNGGDLNVTVNAEGFLHLT